MRGARWAARAGLLAVGLVLLACGGQDEALYVPPMTPGIGAVRPSPLAAVRTPDPCDALKPAGSPPVGTPAQGPYQRLRLPGDLASLEAAAITAGLRGLEATPDWPCIRRLYPEAVAIYLALAGRTPLVPARPTPTPRRP